MGGRPGCQPVDGGTDEEHAERIGQILLGRLARESVRVLWLARSPDAHHPRPPTQPVVGTPSVARRPAESQHSVPAPMNHVFPCISAGPELDPDSESCFGPAEKVWVLARLAGPNLCMAISRHARG